MTSKRFYLKNILSKRNNGEPHSIIPFKGNKIMIGRGLHSNYIIDDITISRSHALFKLSEEAGTWTVQNKSSGGVIVNNEQIPKDAETNIDVGSIIQFGQSKLFIYRFGMKEIKIKTDTKDSATDNVDLNVQHATLELRLQESERIRESLLHDQQHIQESLENERHQLQQQYNKQYEELERKYSEGVLAQKSVLQEKEILAQLLQCKVTDMQLRIEEEKSSLEEKLRREEATRQRLLEEKDLVVMQLQEEKKALELRLEEERKEMEKRLNEEHQQLREQLVSLKEQRSQLEQKVHEKEQSLLEKEEIQLKHEEDQRKTAETLLDEKRQLMSRLQEVESTLEEKIILTSTLTLELKEKEEIEKRLLALQEEKHKLELELHVAAKKGEQHLQISHLEEALNILEAQKMSLEQDAASAATVSEDVRKQVVENVSSVVENELQCPICNELFVTAIMLNCSHVFCKFCIDSWKKTKRDCPNCRASISTESRAYVLDNFIEKIVQTLSEDTKKRREDMIAERTVAELAVKAAEATAAAARAETAQGSRRGRNRNNRGGRRGGGYYNFPHVTLPVQNLTTDVVHNNIHIIGPNAYAQNRIVVIPPAAPRPLTNRPTSLLGAPTVSGHLRPVHIIQVANDWATVNRLRNPGFPAFRMGNPVSFHNPSLSARIPTTSSGPNANTFIVRRMQHP